MKHFHRRCIKHVKGLFVSRHFNSAISTAPSRYQSVATKTFTRRHTAASGRKHAFQYLDAKNDKSSPGTGEGRAAAIPPTRIPSAAALISFDPFVPAKSSRSGDILRAITKFLPAKNSRKQLSVDFRRRATAFYFWEGTSATRWDEVAPIERVIERLLFQPEGDYQRFPRSPRSPPPPRSPPRPPPPPP
jgi:hypothetical protein